MQSFSDIQELLKNEFSAVNQLILSCLNTEDKLIQQIGEHLINSGGKRLRPLLVLLTAGALGEITNEHIKLAAIIEFIHTVTLLHDDVVDASELRRGEKTANFIWGNEASILVGDFLYSRAFQMMAELNNMEVIKVFADTTNIITRGEVLQLTHTNDPNTTEATYLKIIEGKTAALFQASTSLSAILNQADDAHTFGLYGFHLGISFQIIDDILDYDGSESQIGKHLGDDLSQGKITLPLIHAMQYGNTKQYELIETAIKTGQLDNLKAILHIIHETESLTYAKQKAAQQIELAIRCLHNLKPSPYKKALELLTNFVLERNH